MNSGELRSAVQHVFQDVAENPASEHPIPVGRELAEGVGYPSDVLDSLPAEVTDAFAGVAYVHGFARMAPGSRLLDLGCGAGTDSLIAAMRGSVVVGLDFSTAMLGRARQGAAKLGLTTAEFQEGSAEAILAADESFDAAMVNGIFNLNPNRDAIFREIFRVLRPGGMVFAAELVLRHPLSEEERGNETNWLA